MLMHHVSRHDVAMAIAPVKIAKPMLIVRMQTAFMLVSAEIISRPKVYPVAGRTSI
jgi:hypothetical protein